MKKGAQNGELGQLLKLAAPISLGLLGGLFMQIVDMMFVGRLGPAAIGGVSIGNAVFVTLMVMALGLSVGLDYLVSHSFGAGKLSECHRYLIQSLFILTIVAFVSMALMWIAPIGFVQFGIGPDIAQQATRYLRAVCWSLWPFLMFSCFRQYLQAMGVAMPALVILILANFVNALCNWVFVYGNWGAPPMGVAGSGLSTCIARGFMLVAIVAYAYRRDRRMTLGLAGTTWRFSVRHMLEIIRLGLPAGLQMLFEVGVFALSTMLAGRLGAVQLAAHQIVLQLASFTFMIPLGVASATAVRIGQALGSHQTERVRRIAWTSFAFGASFAVIMALAMYGFSRPLLRIFSTDEAVLGIGATLLLVAALFQVSDAVQVIGSGVLRGIGNTQVSMYTNLAGHWLLGLPVGYVLCFRVGWGTHGLWIGLSVGLTAVAATLLCVWWRKSSALSGALAEAG